MKKLILTLLFATNCYAEPFVYNKQVICGEFRAVLSMLEQYKEKITFSGKPEGASEEGSIIVLMENSQTGTWTLLQHNDKIACILGVGKNTKI